MFLVRPLEAVPSSSKLNALVNRSSLVMRRPLKSTSNASPSNCEPDEALCYGASSLTRNHVASHPDKIKASDNQTKEEAESYFVEITKAYKS